MISLKIGKIPWQLSNTYIHTFNHAIVLNQLYVYKYINSLQVWIPMNVQTNLEFVCFVSIVMTVVISSQLELVKMMRTRKIFEELLMEPKHMYTSNSNAFRFLVQLDNVFCP